MKIRNPTHYNRNSILILKQIEKDLGENLTSNNLLQALSDRRLLQVEKEIFYDIIEICEKNIIGLYNYELLEKLYSIRAGRYADMMNFNALARICSLLAKTSLSKEYSYKAMEMAFSQKGMVIYTLTDLIFQHQHTLSADEISEVTTRVLNWIECNGLCKHDTNVEPHLPQMLSAAGVSASLIQRLLAIPRITRLNN